jgi:hypothetical protein
VPSCDRKVLWVHRTEQHSANAIAGHSMGICGSKDAAAPSVGAKKPHVGRTVASNTQSLSKSQSQSKQKTNSTAIRNTTNSEKGTKNQNRFISETHRLGSRDEEPMKTVPVKPAPAVIRDTTQNTVAVAATTTTAVTASDAGSEARRLAAKAAEARLQAQQQAHKQGQLSQKLAEERRKTHKDHALEEYQAKTAASH